MLVQIKNLIKSKKSTFNAICKSNNLSLSFQNNQNETGMLKDIFCGREYSDYFPFYKKVTIVDIGAHYGYFSIFASNNTDKDSQIIAIEPNKINFRNLEKNIADCKIDNIRSCNCAIGDENGVTRLYQGNSANHSIIDNYLLADNNKEYEEVEVKTLEGIVKELDLKTIDFLKIDCEGAEYSIFKSTPGSIFDKITTISMEFHDLKNKNSTAEHLIFKLIENKFKIVKFHFDKTSMNLNYGKLIATKMFN